jgi:Uma2 family endonuclease
MNAAEPLYQRHWIHVHEYHQMGAAGIFGEDARVELIDGEIIDMPPIGSPHAAAVKRLVDRFGQVLGQSAILSVQDPVHLDDFNEPEPDIALLRRRDDYYAAAHPTAADVLLIVEVAESSLRYDRDKKLPLYARAGIPETWLVDLTGRALWVYRQPGADGYAEARQAEDLAAMAPAALPGCRCDLRGLL